MRLKPGRHARWLFGWALVALAGATVLVRVDIAQRREDFQAEARIAHRLLSQRAAEADAILATLALLEPGASPTAVQEASLRLPRLYPHVLAVLHRAPRTAWPDAALAEAEARSRALPALRRHPVLAGLDPQAGQALLVLAGESAGYALRMDLRRMAAVEGWPLLPAGATRAELALGASSVVLDPGPTAAQAPTGLTLGFTFAKTLAPASQPLELRLRRPTGPAQWPWALLLAWLAGSGLVAALLAAWRHAQAQQRRVAELMRLSQVARLNLLGELAAGMAHELNQPLTAVLSSTQAAQRLLPAAGQPLPDEQDLATARQALALAAAQARRAADVLARLRRLVEQPQTRQPRTAVAPRELAVRLLDLMSTTLRQRGIAAQVLGDAPPVQADAVALEQIVHNLLTNAMQALEEDDAPGKAITLLLDAEGGQGRLRVRDNGPGIAPDALPRVFEPFFTRRRGGLGLGLSLCETLAQGMDGQLSAANAAPRGAEFTLRLPLAATQTPPP